MMVSVKEQYLDILANGASLTAICEVLARTLGNPVALTLPTRTIIARSRSYSDDLMQEYVATPELMTDEEEKENYDLMNQQILTRKPFYGRYPYLRYKHMNCGCFWKGSLIGVVDVPVIRQTDIPAALQQLEEACGVFSSALVLNGGVPNGTVDPMETYLIGLLHGNILPEHQQNFRYNIPFHSISYWRVIWVEADEASRLPDITGQVYAFCSSQQSIWCTSWSGGLVILMDAKRYLCIQQLQQLIPDASFAISEKFSRLLSTSAQVQKVRFALKLAQFEDVKDKIIFGENYKIPMFFLSCAQSAGPEEYKSFLPERIKQYDLAHNSEYFPTLRAYLLDNMDVNRMAADLNIHRNTVTYRLQRIQELFDVDLSDCRVITELYLSLFTDLISDNHSV